MKSKLLKIGSLITFLSVLFVQLQVKGSNTVEECETSKSYKPGHYKETTSTETCTICMHRTVRTEIRDEHGVLIGYGYAPYAHPYTIAVTECVVDNNEDEGCTYDHVDRVQMLCPPIFSAPDTGTSTGTH